MNANETARLAAAINLLRPEWPTESLTTFLERGTIARRPFRDAAVALTYVACDPTSKTPARVNEAGPWWRIGDNEPEPAMADRCSSCHGIHTPTSPCDERPSERSEDWLEQLRREVRKTKSYRPKDPAYEP